MKKTLITVALVTLLIAWAADAQHNVSGGLPLFAYSHIGALTTTTVKSLPGALHSVVVNNAGSNPCTVVLYDSTTATGTQIAALDCSSSRQLNYDIAFANGLTVLTVSTATQNITAPDLTVTFQ